MIKDYQSYYKDNRNMEMFFNELDETSVGLQSDS